jgi:hypothetical protein
VDDADVNTSSDLDPRLSGTRRNIMKIKRKITEEGQKEEGCKRRLVLLYGRFQDTVSSSSYMLSNGRRKTNGELEKMGKEALMTCSKTKLKN